eukprot:6179152-Pleurochrysis_carterae.AAC.1
MSMPSSPLRCGMAGFHKIAGHPTQDWSEQFNTRGAIRDMSEAEVRANEAPGPEEAARATRERCGAAELARGGAVRR